jgi:hypothetical protein
VDDETFTFQWDREHLYINISKPTEADLSFLEWFTLTSPNPDLAARIRRKRQGPAETPSWRHHTHGMEKTAWNASRRRRTKDIREHDTLLPEPIYREPERPAG